MIRIPFSQIGSADQFAKAVEAHQKALVAHMMGATGKPAPRAPELVESVIQRVPQAGPVATRGPDKFEIVPYEIFDDRPVDPSVASSIQLLRETIKGG